MNAMICALSVMGALAGANRPAEPQWLTDYGTALTSAAEADKPVAVFLVPGQADAEEAVAGGDIKDALLREYVCVRVDTTTATGRTLAKSFEMTGDTGLVISNRGATVQAFSHDGTLPADEVATRLARYSEPEFVVVRTETTPVSTSTVVAPSRPVTVTPVSHTPTYQPTYVPATYAPSPVWRQGGYCPNCRR